MIPLITSNNIYIGGWEPTVEIKYRGSSNQFDIDYENAPSGFYNQCRIEGSLQNTSFPVKETVYRQSNGVFRYGTVEIEKTKELHTAWKPEKFHENLVQALKHSDFFVDNIQYHHQGDYEFEYNEFDEEYKAKAVLYTQGYNKTNKQC